MADSSQNSSSLDDSTPSTVYELPIVNKSLISNRKNESSIKSTESSHDSSAVFDNSDSLALQDDWSGNDSRDLEMEITDPLDGIFYHLMLSQENTTILFYHRELFKNLLSVLSKQFKFPSEEVQTFTVKTHVNKAQCFLYIDKRIMTIRASGPGHMPWRENNFKRLSANLYRTFIKETDSVLNSSNTTDNQNNASLSASQVSTQPNQSGGNYSTCTIEETQVQPPAVLVAEQPGQVDPATSLQVTPVILHITTLMDMIHKLQRQISILTQQVNKLVEQAANESLYRTVDETNADPTQTQLHEDKHQPLFPVSGRDLNDGQEHVNNPAGHAAEQEPALVSNTVGHGEEISSPVRMSTDGFSSPDVDLPDLQTRSYSQTVMRTSTPRSQQRSRPTPTPRSRPTLSPRTQKSGTTSTEFQPKTPNIVTTQL